MKRIGRGPVRPVAGMLILLFWLGIGGLVLPGGATLSAQDFDESSAPHITAHVTDAEMVAGDTFRLTIEVLDFNRAALHTPHLPSMAGLHKQQQRPDIHTENVTRQGMRYVKTEYTWLITANRSGRYRIPSISIDWNGETLETEPIGIHILPVGQRHRLANIKTPDMKIEWQLSNTDPYVGEQLVAELILYSRPDIRVTSYELLQGVSSGGFWQQELDTRVTPYAETERINGMRYRKNRLYRQALFPQRAEPLRVAEASVIVHTRPDNRSSSSESNRSPDSLRLMAEEKTVHPRTLPSPPRNTEATGFNAVGNLEINRRLSQTSATLGSTFEVITEISGTGNLGLMDHPPVDYPGLFDLKNRSREMSLQLREERLTGSVTFRDEINPQRAGRHTLEPVELTYFDPGPGVFRTIELPELEIRINRNPDATITYEGTDLSLSPVTRAIGLHQPASFSYARQWWVYAGIAMPVVLLALGLVLLRYYPRAFSTDQRLSARTAWKQCRNLLDEARDYLERCELQPALRLINEAACHGIAMALEQPGGATSREQLMHHLDNGLVPQHRDAAQLSQLLKRLERLFYTPGLTAAQVETVRQQTEQSLAQLFRGS